MHAASFKSTDEVVELLATTQYLNFSQKGENWITNQEKFSYRLYP